jgi:hypothetical protein
MREYCLQSFIPGDGLVLDTHICPKNPHVICVVRDHLVAGARVESNKPYHIIIFAGNFFETLKKCPAAISSILVQTAALILPASVRRNVRKFRLQQGYPSGISAIGPVLSTQEGGTAAWKDDAHGQDARSSGTQS